MQKPFKHFSGHNEFSESRCSVLRYLGRKLVYVRNLGIY